MQSAARRTEPSSGGDKEQDMAVSFDVTAPVEVMLNTLRRHRPTEEAQGSVGSTTGSTAKARGDEGGSSFLGASLVHEKELMLKILVLQILSAENRKVLFVKGGEDNDVAPRLLRMLSVSDVWWLLIGSDAGNTVGGES